MTITRTFDLLDKYKENFQKEDALCFKHNGVWVKYSSQEYIENSYNFCYGLYELGYRKGDKIITVSTNRPEWNFADMGMAMIGIVHVPVFTSLNAGEYEYIIRDSGARMILISDKKLFKCVSISFKGTVSAIKAFSFDSIEGVANWIEIVNAGKRRKTSSGRQHLPPSFIHQEQQVNRKV